MEQELEKAKDELEREVTSGNFNVGRIYELSSKIDELVIQKYNQQMKQRKGWEENGRISRK